MKELTKKYGKIAAISVLGIFLAFLLFKGASYVYKNSYADERYQYSSKILQNQALDQNVTILKSIKRNGSEGEIKITFDKKDLNEEYQILLDESINPSNVEVSVTGKINSGDMTVKMVDETNKDMFTRTVKGPNIKEVSTSDAYSKSYKLSFVPNAAQNGDLVVKFKFR